MARRHLSVALAALALAGCPERLPAPPVTIVKTVTVEVPVAVKTEPPVELLAPVSAAPLPIFVDVIDPKAASALTADGEMRLRSLIVDLLARIEAWRAWATAK